jgi:hypothetical protein
MISSAADPFMVFTHQRGGTVPGCSHHCSTASCHWQSRLLNTVDVAAGACYCHLLTVALFNTAPRSTLQQCMMHGCPAAVRYLKLLAGCQWQQRQPAQAFAKLPWAGLIPWGHRLHQRLSPDGPAAERLDSVTAGISTWLDCLRIRASMLMAAMLIADGCYGWASRS